jgi:hypothetical protein
MPTLAQLEAEVRAYDENFQQNGLPTILRESLKGWSAGMLAALPYVVALVLILPVLCSTGLLALFTAGPSSAQFSSNLSSPARGRPKLVQTADGTQRREKETETTKRGKKGKKRPKKKSTRAADRTGNKKEAREERPASPEAAGTRPGSGGSGASSDDGPDTDFSRFILPQLAPDKATLQSEGALDERKAVLFFDAWQRRVRTPELQNTLRAVYELNGDVDEVKIVLVEMMYEAFEEVGLDGEHAITWLSERAKSAWRTRPDLLQRLRRWQTETGAALRLGDDAGGPQCPRVPNQQARIRSPP